jgi:undecaprenyl phosphate N,N'-diacetylbacillosamine 1-phosphate transferase
MKILYINYFKRIFDFILSLILILISFPILTIAILILIFQNDGDIFFLQTRPGRKGKLFNVIKLKTMKDLYDNKGNILPDGERITQFGNLLRKSSIDEIPQLWNVLKGEMSLIGPRPLLVEYLPLYTDEQRRRHDIRPGITGWAQINGRNSTKFSTRFEMDVWYVDNLSLKLDLKILFITFQKVFKSEGIIIDQDPSEIADFTVKN